MHPSSDCLRAEQFFDHYLVFVFRNICHLHLSLLRRYVQVHAVLTLDFHLYGCQVLSAISPSCNLLTTNFYSISFV